MINDSTAEPDPDRWPQDLTKLRSRIMYIEYKGGELEGPARIGRVYFSRSGKTLYYGGRRFRSLNGTGFKSNFVDSHSGEDYWISGPRKDQNDRLYGGNRGVEVDDDVREEYSRLVGKKL